MDRTLLRSLTGKGSARDLADLALVSRSEWYRRFESEGLRAPIRVRTRLRLERAAHRLVRSEASISEIGVQAGFAHTSAFTRAFTRAYGLAPRAFRAHRPSEWRLPPFDGLHFAPGNGVLDPRQGTLTMKLIDLWIADHVRAAEILLRSADSAPAARVEGLSGSRFPFPWQDPAPRPVEELFDVMAGFAEPWTHYLDAKPPTANDGTLAGRLAQLKENADRFGDLVHRFEEEGSWDMTFVDAGCEPPVVFSYGSVVLHVIVYTNHVRVELDTELRSRGVLADFVPPATVTG